MAHDVIISCCQEDLEPAEAALQALESAGYSCWISARDLKKKARENSLSKAIRSARVIVVIFSVNTSETNLLASDLNMALNAGLKIIPLRVANAKPTTVMQYYLADTQWLDFDTTPDNNQLSLLIEAVKTALHESRRKGRVKAPHHEKSGLFYPWPMSSAITVALAVIFLMLFALGSFSLTDSLSRLMQALSGLVSRF